MSRSSLALVNLRAVVILIVLAFHSVLPYLASLPPTPYPFDSAPYQWLAFPIVDSQRWFGFDLFCAWQDVGLMSLMFFLSGLFVPSSLARKGSWRFLSDRLLRIGLPMALAVIFLAPLAYYAAYRTTAVDPSLDAYWQHWLALPFWPCGPQWFLWPAAGVQCSRGRDCIDSFPDGIGGLSGWWLRRRQSGAVLCRSGDDLRAGLHPAGAGLFTVRMDEHRPHRLSAQPTVALPRLFPCRHGGRDPWPRPWPARLRWGSGAALDGMARRSHCRFPALGRCRPR